MRTHGAVVGRLFRSVTKLTTKVRIGRGYLWGIFLIAAAALKTPTRNGYNAHGVNLNFVCVCGGVGGCAGGLLEAVPALSWCGVMSLGGIHIIIINSCYPEGGYGMWQEVG